MWIYACNETFWKRGAVMADELFNDAVKAIKASEKMSDLKYTVTKNRILIECADLGEEAQAFIQEFFKLADEKRDS